MYNIKWSHLVQVSPKGHLSCYCILESVHQTKTCKNVEVKPRIKEQQVTKTELCFLLLLLYDFSNLCQFYNAKIPKAVSPIAMHYIYIYIKRNLLGECWSLKREKETKTNAYHGSIFYTLHIQPNINIHGLADKEKAFNPP